MRRTRSRRTTSVAPTGLVTAVLAGLLLVALAACGQESDRAEDPESRPDATTSGPTSSEPTSSEPTATAAETIPVTGDAGVETSRLLSATSAGGRVETLATALDSEQARADFVAGLEPALGEAVLEAVEELAESAGELPYGVVTSVGCDAPVGARIDAGEAGYEVTPTLPKETVQCLAPVTFVLVFTG